MTQVTKGPELASTNQEDSTNEIRQITFVSILADGSTEVSMEEQVVVYLRYVSEGEVKTSLQLKITPVH